MGKGFGVGSIILATVGIFVPVAGIFIGWLVPGIAESRHRLGQQSRWKPDLIDGTGRDSRFTDVGY